MNTHYNILEKQNRTHTNPGYLLADATYDTLSPYENVDLINVKLPPDWFMSLDSESGKIYYCNVTTKTTQWLHPCIPLGTIMPNGIPYGWDTAFDKNGKRYWIKYVDGYNTWTKPY